MQHHMHQSAMAKVSSRPNRHLVFLNYWFGAEPPTVIELAQAVEDDVIPLVVLPVLGLGVGGVAEVAEIVG